MMYRFIYYIVAMPVLLLLIGCSQEPAEIHYQQDECEHCKMMIADSRFAAQLVTEKGKAHKFDAIECLTSYRHNHSGQLDGTAIWVSDFRNPGTWLKGTEAVYIQSEVIRSPMGQNLLAFENKAEAKEHLEEYPGEILTWTEVRQIVQ